MFFRTESADPADLQRLADAFDAAWIAVNAQQPIASLAASAERERLSYILIRVWQSEPHSDLAAVASERFLAGDGAVSLTPDAADHPELRAPEPEPPINRSGVRGHLMDSDEIHDFDR